MKKSSHNKKFSNVFHDLTERRSILLTLFNMKTKEIFELGAQAPSPSKDYCQLVMTHNMVIFRKWRITLRSDSESRYPSETKDSYEDFIYDENLQDEIARVFGLNTLVYMQNIIEKGKLDYLLRLPENVIIKIISNLDLEDLSRLSQVNGLFRQLCRSDKVWMTLYKKYYSSEITRELLQLAERDGWRKLFFTNKIKLKLELRRQAKGNNDNSDCYDENDSIYHTPRRSESSAPKLKPRERNGQPGAKFHNSTFFLTEK